MGCCQATRTDNHEVLTLTISSCTLQEQISSIRTSQRFDDVSLNSPSPTFKFKSKPVCGAFAETKRTSLLESSFLHLPEELTAVPMSFSRSRREFSSSREKLPCF